MIERFRRGSAKLLNRAIWARVALHAKSPQVEVLHENDTDGKVLCVNGPAYIEPELGYIISEDGFLLEDSLLTYSGAKPFNYNVPSAFRFWKSRQSPKNVIDLPEVILMRYFYEWNYYHFYFDVLSKLELLHHTGFSTDIPLIVAKYIDDAKFVRPLISRGDFSHYNWLNPDKKYIRADKIIFCKTSRPYKDRLSFINKALHIEELSAPTTDRVFLNRPNRRLANFDEVVPLLTAHNFNIVDTTHMSLDEQIEIFSKVRYLVTIHGAGTTNIIFRGNNPLSVLELHSDRYINYDHKRICDEMGYFWDDLAGEPLVINNNNSDFYISPEALDKKIVELLQT